MGYWRIVLAVLLAATLAFWIVALVGTASMQAVCDDGSSLESLHAGGAPFRRALSCGSALRLPWVFLVLEALALVGVALSMCLGGLAHSAFSWLAIFAVLSAVCIFIVEAMVAVDYGGGDGGDRARTAQAGWVPIAALNALMAFWLGWRQHGGRGGHAGAGGGAGGGGLPMSGGGSPGVVKY